MSEIGKNLTSNCENVTIGADNLEIGKNLTSNCENVRIGSDNIKFEENLEIIDGYSKYIIDNRLEEVGNPCIFQVLHYSNLDVHMKCCQKFYNDNLERFMQSLEYKNDEDYKNRKINFLNKICKFQKKMDASFIFDNDLVVNLLQKSKYKDTTKKNLLFRFKDFAMFLIDGRVIFRINDDYFMATFYLNYLTLHRIFTIRDRTCILIYCCLDAFDQTENYSEFVKNTFELKNNSIFPKNFIRDIINLMLENKVISFDEMV
jgi:hypothetical protein